MCQVAVCGCSRRKSVDALGDCLQMQQAAICRYVRWASADSLDFGYQKPDWGSVPKDRFKDTKYQRPNFTLKMGPGLKATNSKGESGYSPS